MDIKENVEDLVNMILTGKMMDAFEKYYAEDVVMQEPGEEPRVGKDVNREFEKKWLEGVQEFHSGEVKAKAVTGNIAMVEWEMDVSFKDGKRMKMNQVAVQEWKDGKIVNERFYYDKSKMGQ